jgi:hypothetical protein
MFAHKTCRVLAILNALLVLVLLLLDDHNRRRVYELLYE